MGITKVMDLRISHAHPRQAHLSISFFLQKTNLQYLSAHPTNPCIYLPRSGCLLGQLGDPDEALEERGGRREGDAKPQHLQHGHLHGKDCITIIRVVSQPNQLIHLPTANIKEKMGRVKVDAHHGWIYNLPFFYVTFPARIHPTLTSCCHYLMGIIGAFMFWQRVPTFG